MLATLCRRLSSNSQLGNYPLKPLFLVRFLSSGSELSLNSNEDHSLAISYLINSCGLSPNSAKSISHRCKFKTLENPDSVLKFLRDCGFSGSQITEIVRKFPEMLTYNAEKTILPKIEFFYSIGISKENLPKFLASNPLLLRRSLKHYTLQCHEIFKSLLHCDDKVSWVFQRLHSHNMWRVQKFLVPNVLLVRELGMPEPFLSKLLLISHEMFLVESIKFSEAVKKIVELGFDPAKYSFAQALLVRLQTSEKRWEAKIELFRRWGLSEDEFFECFKRQQRWMLLAEDSLERKMRFLVGKIGLKPEFFVRNPVVFSLSLEKRIVPRFAVLRILFLKGLTKKEQVSPYVLWFTEEKFLAKFVNPHRSKEPRLLDVLQGKMDIRELGFEFEHKENTLPR